MTMEVTKKYKHNKMKHPVGMVTYGSTLYVGEQDQNVILTFDIETTQFKSIVVHKLISEIEQLTLSFC
jgi:hypothetical protein